MFVHTIYQSRARVRITENDIVGITAQSLSNNVKNGLTSFMYYDDTRFLQIIEGRPAEVASAMKRITKNSLHHSITVRVMNRSSTRNFEG